MYPASAAFKNAVRNDHIVIAKAEIYRGEQLLTTLDIDTGSVSIDAKSAVRRTCEIHLMTDRTNNNLVPDTDFDALSPFGNELRVYRGIQYSDGTEEYVPLGVFVITEIDINDTNEGVDINVRGEDRSILITRNKWLEPYQMVDGTLEDSLTALLTDRFDDIVTNFPATNVTVNQVILGAEESNDPWKDAVELAELVGFDLYFDVNGVATLKQFPTLDGSVVVATFVEAENQTLTSLTRTISSKETYNGVIYVVEGSNVDTPIRIEAWDEDTTSPTYRYGPFGEAPTFIKTNVITSEADAIKAATLLLNTYIGAQEAINWSALVDPTLDVNDVIYIKSSGAKVDRLVIIDSLTIPLAPQDELSGVARVVRVVNADEVIEVGA